MRRWATTGPVPPAPTPVTPLLTVLVTVLVVLASTACSDGGGVQEQTVPSSAPGSATGPSSASPSVGASGEVSDPRAQPAVAAYERFFTLGLQALRDPAAAAAATGTPGPGDYRAYAVDPILGQYTAYVLGLAQDEVAYRGDPPRPRITVTDIALDADPHPRVTLANCPTPAPTWQAYSLSDDGPVPEPTPTVAPPYRLSVTVIEHDGAWAVSEVAADQSATCTG